MVPPNALFRTMVPPVGNAMKEPLYLPPPELDRVPINTPDTEL